MNAYIVAWLKRDEGLRLFPYLDTAKPPKWTIGYGRNLSDNGISEPEAEILLNNDLQRTVMEARSFPWFESLDEVRQAVVLDMIYNLGLDRFKGFLGTIEAIRLHDFEAAATRMGQSAWRMQVRERAERLMGAMRSGKSTY